MKHVKKCCSLATKVGVFSLSCLLIGCKAPDNTAEKKVNTVKTMETKPNNTVVTNLQHKVLSATRDANAKSPTRGQRVTVHYTGWLYNPTAKNETAGYREYEGKKFDSSVDRGQPFVFRIGIGQVIQGWDTGVAEMKIGEKARLIIPAHLGYGAHGAGAAIPPNATLVFDVELIDVQ